MKPIRSLPAAAVILAIGSLAEFPLTAQAQSAQGSGSQQISSGLTAQVNADGTATVTIPGPLAFFQRIAAISRKASPEQVLPFLARNVVVDGYSHGQGRNAKPTEYLKLLDAYLDQARELESLADLQGRIRITGCAQAEPLLRILGYRLRTTCGPDTSVETADPERAFLTVDSGFPLVELEESLQRGTPFDYSFQSSTVPVLFTPKDWAWVDNNLVDTLLEDPALARLYWAFSRLDGETAELLRQSPGLKGLLPLAPILDFYGSHLAVRAGKVVVPGGVASEGAWKELVSARIHRPNSWSVSWRRMPAGWRPISMRCGMCRMMSSATSPNPAG